MHKGNYRNIINDWYVICWCTQCQVDIQGWPKSPSSFAKRFGKYICIRKRFRTSVSFWKCSAGESKHLGDLIFKVLKQRDVNNKIKWQILFFLVEKKFVLNKIYLVFFYLRSKPRDYSAGLYIYINIYIYVCVCVCVCVCWGCVRGKNDGIRN